LHSHLQKFCTYLYRGKSGEQMLSQLVLQGEIRPLVLSDYTPPGFVVRYKCKSTLVLDRTGFPLALRQRIT
jgi:hypothetical protein